MPGRLTIRLALSWSPEEPDGSPCLACGDPIYYPRQWRLVIRILDGPALHDDDGPVACDACHDGLD